MPEASQRIQRGVTMTALILAGGVIYTLPYLRQTFHRGLLVALNVDNTQLGNLNAVFGLVAMLSYFPGGWLADRVSARRLLTGSLVATGVAGLWFSTFPPYGVVVALHAFMGLSTILTFWAALIKATRFWGGPKQQGWAFGILDGGRGVVEAALASLVVFAFAAYADAATGPERLALVINLYAVAHFAVAILVWFTIPETPTDERFVLHRGLWGQVLRLPTVWLLAVVILVAYGGYWGTHDFNAFATGGLGRSEEFGATLATFRTWLRPIAAISAGLLADRFRPTAVITAAFAVTGVGFIALSVLSAPGGLWLWVEVATIALAVFALRATYYALLEEGRIPAHLTGVAVGFVSVIGYTPDIFIPLLTGRLFDTFPGADGHRIFYVCLALSCVVGIIATLAMRPVARRQS